MKKIALFLAVLTLLLYACGNAPATDADPQENPVQTDSEENVVTLTDEEIKELVEGDWFYYGMTQMDTLQWGEYDVIEFGNPDYGTLVGDTIYYKVVQDGFQKWDEFVSFVNSVYTPNVSEYRIFMVSEHEKQYISIDGDLYYNGGGGRGTDVSSEFTFKVIESSANEATAEVYREYIFDDEDGFETTVYNFEMTPNGWRIANRDTSKITAPEDEVIELLKKAAFIDRALNCGGLSCGGEAEMIDGYEYYPVTDTDFDEWQEWEAYVESVYSWDYKINEILSDARIIKVGDKTYTDGGGRGYDLSDNFEWHQVISYEPDSTMVFGIAFNPYVGGGDGGVTTGYDVRLTSAGWRIDTVYGT